MATSNKTAVLIVHGAYFLPESWTPFMVSLTNAGFLTKCPRLPTCGDSRPPTATFPEDVAAVRNAAIELAHAGHPIIVLAHSYGGMVASEAIHPDLYAKPPAGGVVALVYLSAFLVLPGQSLSDLLGKYGFQSKVDLGSNHDGTVYAKNAPDSFYNDIDTPRAQELAAANVTHNVTAFAGKAENSPWKDLLTVYVHCERDMSIFVDLQRSMVKDALELGGAKQLVTKSCDSGHCPFLSVPGQVLKIVEDTATDVLSGK